MVFVCDVGIVTVLKADCRVFNRKNENAILKAHAIFIQIINSLSGIYSIWLSGRFFQSHSNMLMCVQACRLDALILALF